MKKFFFLLLSFIAAFSTTQAQKGIDSSITYAAGGKLLITVDSLAKNIFYANMFPNMPRTAFSYLNEINNVNIQIYFRKTDNIEDYRYTILIDEKPVSVNKAIDKKLLKDVEMPEVFSTTSLGIFPIKGKTITTLVYNIERPLEVDKSIFYGKPIPKAQIQGFSKRFKTDKGVDYSWITEPKDSTNLNFTEKDDQFTIVKDASDIDYVYQITIKDKRTDQVIYESTAWNYGGIRDEKGFLPYLNIDRSIFKKSGIYEIMIQPALQWKDCLKCDISEKEIESFTTRHTLSVTLDQENYSRKELIIYALVAAFIIGLAFLIAFYFIRKRNKKWLTEQEQQKNTAKLQLSSIRAQLDPHFLFNALSGIQNLMNKNDMDNANKYLSKFARLTRNILDNNELISLSKEKMLLDDYLQMEQLRFGFKYEIHVAENLELDNIEIPSMLLQPFVENAVKHGMAARAEQGEIKVKFTREANNLILIVSDNGSGFDTKSSSTGLGISLSNNRIALLNSVYKENRFILGMQSTSNGTHITLTLTHWL